MKRSNAYVSGLLLAGSTMLFSCEKTDLSSDVEIAAERDAAACDIASFRYTAATGNGTINKFVFQKQNNPATGKLKQIKAAIYQGGAITSTATFDVRWRSGSIIFLRGGSITDTVLVVSLNGRGRPVQAIAGNKPDANYLPTLFEYNNNRLAAMKISLAGNLITSRFAYDDRGNCISVKDDQQGSQVPGRVEYAYNNNRAVNQQVYNDDPRPFSWNTFSLLQFSGFFPELQPSRLRTSTKVFWVGNYKAYDVQLINHQVNDGKLVKYEVSFGGSTPTVPHYIDWICNDNNGDDDDDDDDDDNDDDDDDNDD